MTFMQGNKKESIFDKHLQIKLVRVSIEVNLILTCRSCSKFWSTGLAHDSFPLPRINQLVDLTAGHKLLSFMDAFSGYNQIMIDEED